MNSSKSSLTNEVSFKEILLGIIDWFRYILSCWVPILLFVIIGGLIGFVHANREKLLYIATSAFVLQEGGGGGDASANTFASILGFNQPEAGGMFQGDNLIEMYRTRFMIKKTLMRKVPDGNDYIIDEYIKLNGLKQFWNQDPQLKNLNFFITPPKSNKLYLRKQDSVMTAIVNDIRDNYLYVDRDRRLNIFFVSIRSPNEDFSKLLDEQIVKTVNDYYIQTKTQKTFGNLSLMQHQFDSLRTALNRQMYKTASSNDFNYNSNPAMQVYKVPSQRSQVDVETNRAMLGEMARNIEVTRMALRKETPLIQVIDEPVYPLPKNKDSRGKAVIVGAVVAGLIAIIYYSLQLLYKKILEQD